MVYIIEFINKNLAIFIPVLTSIITAYSVYWLAKEKNSKEIREQQYYNLIFPIFNLIEPDLYSKPNKKILKLINKIIIENQAIASRLLLFWSNESLNGDKIAYEKLCSLIASEYDKLCLKLNIPGRTMSYKIKRKQFPNKFSYLKAVICFFIIHICLPIFIALCYILTVTILLAIIIN